MPQNLLEQLRKYTVVVADTGDIEAMEKFRPQDATTNPSLITAAAQMPQYQPIVDGVLKERARNWAKAQPTGRANLAFQRLAIAFGKRFSPSFPAASPPKSTRASPTTPRPPSPRPAPSLPVRPGRHRPRAHPHQDRLHLGRHPRRRSAGEGRHPLQPDAALRPAPGHRRAEAGVTLVSPFVGRILDWYKKDTGKDYHGADDPGVHLRHQGLQLLQEVRLQDAGHGRQLPQHRRDQELAGCDLLTISPQLLAELESTEGDLPRKLDPEAAKP
jgi:transaldolase